MNMTRMNRALAAAMTMLMAAGPAFADHDKWDDDDHGHKGKHERGYEDRRDDRRDDHRYEERRDHEGDRHVERRGSDVNVNVYFGDRQRTVVHEYYVQEYRTGRCPPGLAKKHNGCMPPGQARRWEVGRPLPRDVVYYDLPPAVVVELGPPPPRHRYVRVAGDILLIAVGTGMVVDAIEDLGGM